MKDIERLKKQLADIDTYLALPQEERTIRNAVLASAETQAALLRVVLELAARR